jgi:hypothetical protein
LRILWSLKVRATEFASSDSTQTRFADASFSSIREWKFAVTSHTFPDSCGKSLAAKHVRADHLIINQVFLSRLRKSNVTDLLHLRQIAYFEAAGSAMWNLFLDFLVSFINQLTTLLQIVSLIVIRKTNGRY